MKHGSPRTYTNHKCRCSECRAAWNAYIKSRRDADPERFRKAVRERRWRQKGTPPTQTCDLCGEVFVAVAVHKAEAHGVRSGVCGTITSYSRGCRCSLCRTAARDTQRAYRARKRERILGRIPVFCVRSEQQAVPPGGHALGFVKRGLSPMNPRQWEWVFDCVCGWETEAYIHVRESSQTVEQMARAAHDGMVSLGLSGHDGGAA